MDSHHHVQNTLACQLSSKPAGNGMPSALPRLSAGPTEPVPQGCMESMNTGGRVQPRSCGEGRTLRKTESCAVSTLVSSLTAASCTPLRTARNTCRRHHTCFQCRGQEFGPDHQLDSRALHAIAHCAEHLPSPSHLRSVAGWKALHSLRTRRNVSTGSCISQT